MALYPARPASHVDTLRRREPPRSQRSASTRRDYKSASAERMTNGVKPMKQHLSIFDSASMMAAATLTAFVVLLSMAHAMMP